MAINKVIRILVRSTKAEKNIKSLNKDLSKTKELNTEVTQTSKGMGKGFNIASLGAKGFAVSIRAIGAALKAAGIGILLSLLAMLTTALMKNERVTKALGAVMDWIGDVVHGVVEVIADFIDKIKSSGDEMGSFQKLVLGIWKMISGYFKFYTGLIILAVANMAEKVVTALNKIGLVSDDTVDSVRDFKEKAVDRVNEGMVDLVEGSKSAAEGLKEVGKAASDSAGNFSKYREENRKAREETERLEKATEEAKKAIEALSKSYEGLYIRLNNQMNILKESGRTLLKMASDESKSYIERRDALEQYIASQTEQLELQRRIAQERVNEAQAIYKLDNSLENYNKLLEAQGELEVVNLQITNDKIDLEEKLFQLQKSREDFIDGIIEKRSGEKSEADKIREEYEATKKALEAQMTGEVELDRELKEALLLNEEWFTEQLKEIEKDRLEAIDEIVREFEEEKEETELEKFEREEEEKLEKALQELEDLEASEEEKAAVIMASAQRVADFKKKLEAQDLKNQQELNKQITTTALGGMNAVLDALDAGAGVKKAFAVSEALWNTFTGISKALDAGFPAAIPGVIFASTTGFGAVSNILSTDKKSSGGAGRGASPQTAQPSFNVVSDNRDTVMDEIDAKMSNEPTKAYVVGSEVTTQQELDRNRVKKSRVL